MNKQINQANLLEKEILLNDFFKQNNPEVIDHLFNTYKVFFWNNLYYLVKYKESYTKCKALFESDESVGPDGLEGEHLFHLLFNKKKDVVIKSVSKHINLDSSTTLSLCFRFNNTIITNLRNLYKSNHHLSQIELMNICKYELFKSKIDIDITKARINTRNPPADVVPNGSTGFYTSIQNPDLESRMKIGYVFIALCALYILYAFYK